jgi:lipoprotein-releasing system permease protein
VSRDQALVAIFIALCSFALALALMAGLWTIGLRLLDQSSKRHASFELFVAVRHLRGRKSGYLKAMTVVVLLAVTMANWTLPTVLSVMGGFGNDLKQKILDATAHILVDSARPDLRLPEEPSPADFDRLAAALQTFPDTRIVVMARQRGPAQAVQDQLRQRGVTDDRMEFQRSTSDSLQGVRLSPTGDGRQVKAFHPLAQRIAKVPGVVGVTPFIEADVMLASATNIAAVVLKGVEPATMDQVIGLRETVEQGRLEYLDQPDAILTDVLAEQERRLKLLLADAGLGNSPLFPDGPPPLPTLSDSGPADGELQASAWTRADAGPDAAPTAVAVPFPGADRLPEPLRQARAVPPGQAPPESPSLPAVIIGRELAKTLRGFVGDEVNVVSPLGDMGPLGPIPKARPFRIGGVFFSGMYQDDAKNAYVHLKVAQKFLGMDGRVSGLRIRVNDIEKAGAIAKQLRADLGPTYRVRPWEEVNANLFSALRLEKIAMFALYSVFFIICAFLIASTLTMMVLEKRRGIAVLKTVGASDQQLGTVFVLQSVLAGLVGTVSGQVASIVLCLALGRFVQIEPEVYYIDRLPVTMEPVEFITVAALALLTAVVATILPLAATVVLRPVDGLRQ